MTTDSQLAEKLTAEHESYLESAGDGLVEAILEGVKEGAAEGLEKGARDALKECLTQGFGNVEVPAIKDILVDIPQDIVKSSVKEGAKRIFKKSTEGYIKKACQKLIKKMQKEGIKPSREETDYILKIFKNSEREALKKLVAKMPQNPLFGSIIAGMQSALEESLEKNFAAYGQKMQKATTPRTAKGRAKMAKNDVNKSVRSLVKKIVSKIVYKLVKASAKKAVAELKKKLKEEFIHKIEDKLKEAAKNQLEKQLTKSSQKLQKEIAQDNPRGSDYVSQMQQSFEKDLNNFLSSLKGISALKVAVISCICALLIGAGVYFGIGPTPPPPDLVITWSEPEWISGEDIVIHYTIANLSEGEAEGSYTCLYINGSFLIQDYVPALGPGEERTLSCPACSLSAEYGSCDIELCVDSFGYIEESDEENNCAKIEPPPPPLPPLPDLVITWFEPEWTEEGVIICYTIANLSEAEAGESYTHLKIGESFLFDDNVAPLGPGQERGECFPTYTPPEEDGFYNMELCADGYGDIDESNEENNCVTIELTPPPQPDLVITDLFCSTFIIAAEELPSEGEGEEGPMFYFVPPTPVVPEADTSTYYFVCSYVIENQSEAEAGMSYTRMYMFISEGPYLSEGPYMVAEVEPLGPGEKREVIFHVYYYPLTDELAFFQTTVCADGNENVEESNEENNCVAIEDIVY